MSMRKVFSSILIVLLLISFVANIFLLSNNKISNSFTCSNFNVENTRLPAGSIVETDSGKWMIVGQRPIDDMDEDGNYSLNTAGYAWIYDYYAVQWPSGTRSVYVESQDMAFINVADITKVIWVGMNDAEQQDYLNYINNYDPTIYNTIQSTGKATGPVFDDSPAAIEQKLRAEGKTSSELYGDNFAGGLLYEDRKASGIVDSSSEQMNILRSQSE